MTYNEALIEERDQGITEIAQQIGEVNEIFQVCSWPPCILRLRCCVTDYSPPFTVFRVASAAKLYGDLAVTFLSDALYYYAETCVLRLNVQGN